MAGIPPSRKNDFRVGDEVWCSKCDTLKESPQLGFVRCQILEVCDAPPNTYKVKQIEPPGRSIYDVKGDFLLFANIGADPASSSELSLLLHANEATVVDVLETRLRKGQIYTFADPILIATNPFQWLNQSGDEIMDIYQNSTNLLETPPHVFRLAAAAERALHDNNGKAQSLIVSGESGSGKTETAKLAMKFYAYSSTNKSGSGRASAPAVGGDGEHFKHRTSVFTSSSAVSSYVQAAVTAANPILEAMGNAKTIKNNNSSRFGRLTLLKVQTGGGIKAGALEQYLLERSRVTSLGKGERNYHIFYQIIRGGSDMLQPLGLEADVSRYNILTNGGCIDIANTDDGADFEELLNSFNEAGLTPEEQWAIFHVVAAVLLLGNFKFDSIEKDGIEGVASVESSQAISSLKKISKLLGIDYDSLCECLTVKLTRAGGPSQSPIRGFYTIDSAEEQVQSLIRSAYGALFAWVVKRLNERTQGTNDPIAAANLWKDNFLAILDIFGFEVFAKNSLEQLMINLTNEKLQQHFTKIVFTQEKALYASEGVDASSISFTDNQAILDLIFRPPRLGASIFSCLEDQTFMPRGTDEQFVQSLFRTFHKPQEEQLALADETGTTKMPPFGKPKIGKAFTVRHTSAEVVYDAEGFISKNKDALKAELVTVLRGSAGRILHQIFAGMEVPPAGGLPKAQFTTAVFGRSLESLMVLIGDTESHFVRCIAPNNDKKPLTVDRLKTIGQIKSLSIIEAINLKSTGYSFRRTFEEFCRLYRMLAADVVDNPSISPSDASKEILNRFNIPADLWQIGKTRVFLKVQAAKELERLRSTFLKQLEAACLMIQSVARVTLCRRDFGDQFSRILGIQRQLRRYRVIRQRILKEQRFHFIVGTIMLLKSAILFKQNHNASTVIGSYFKTLGCRRKFLVYHQQKKNERLIEFTTSRLRGLIVNSRYTSLLRMRTLLIMGAARVRRENDIARQVIEQWKFFMNQRRAVSGLKIVKAMQTRRNVVLRTLRSVVTLQNALRTFLARLSFKYGDCPVAVTDAPLFGSADLDSASELALMSAVGNFSVNPYKGQSIGSHGELQVRGISSESRTSMSLNRNGLNDQSHPHATIIAFRTNSHVLTLITSVTHIQTVVRGWLVRRNLTDEYYDTFTMPNRRRMLEIAKFHPKTAIDRLQNSENRFLPKSVRLTSAIKNNKLSLSPNVVMPSHFNAYSNNQKRRAGPFSPFARNDRKISDSHPSRQTQQVSLSPSRKGLHAVYLPTRPSVPVPVNSEGRPYSKPDLPREVFSPIPKTDFAFYNTSKNQAVKNRRVGVISNVVIDRMGIKKYTKEMTIEPKRKYYLYSDHKSVHHNNIAKNAHENIQYRESYFDGSDWKTPIVLKKNKDQFHNIHSTERLVVNSNNNNISEHLQDDPRKKVVIRRRKVQIDDNLEEDTKNLNKKVVSERTSLKNPHHQTSTLVERATKQSVGATSHHSFWQSNNLSQPQSIIDTDNGMPHWSSAAVARNPSVISTKSKNYNNDIHGNHTHHLRGKSISRSNSPSISAQIHRGQNNNTQFDLNSDALW